MQSNNTSHLATESDNLLIFRQPECRNVILHRGKKGFGFVLRGAKATSPLMDRSHGERGGPALQYLDDVDPGGVADLAGLKPGDYLLKVGCGIMCNLEVNDLFRDLF